MRNEKKKTSPAQRKHRKGKVIDFLFKYYLLIVQKMINCVSLNVHFAGPLVEEEEKTDRQGKDDRRDHNVRHALAVPAIRYEKIKMKKFQSMLSKRFQAPDKPRAEDGPRENTDANAAKHVAQGLRSPLQ